MRLGTELLKNTNRKPYTIYRMVPLSMTLSDLWPRFQGHDIFFEVEYRKNNLFKNNLVSNTNTNRTHAVPTRSSADADKSARRVKRSVKVTKHSTIPYVRYSLLLVRNSNIVFKTRRFSDIRLQKCRDLEIRVTGHSRSLKVVPFDRLGVVSY